MGINRKWSGKLIHLLGGFQKAEEKIYQIRKFAFGHSQGVRKINSYNRGLPISRGKNLSNP